MKISENEKKAHWAAIAIVFAVSVGSSFLGAWFTTFSTWWAFIASVWCFIAALFSFCMLINGIKSLGGKGK